MRCLIILNDPPYGTERSYNGLRLALSLVTKDAQIGARGSCLDARGMSDADIMPGVRPSSMAELAAWTLWADKVVTF